MPLQMDYTDGTGTDHPDSYWHLSDLELNPIAQTARFCFACYASQAEFAAQMQPVTTHVYLLTAGDFSAIATTTVTGPLGPSATAAVESWALAAPDGFFAGATQVP